MKLLVFVTLVSLSFAWQSYAPGEGPFDHMSNEEFAAIVIKIKVIIINNAYKTRLFLM